MRLATILAAFVCMLAGCVAPPRRLEPAAAFATPREWDQGSAARLGETPEHWWDEFGDPRLAAAVQEALTRNYDLEAALARMDQATATARIEGADLYPHADATLGVTRQKRNFIGFPVPGENESGQLEGIESTQWDGALNVSWEIDLWGRLRNRKRAALADVQRAAADVEAARLSLAAQTAKTWFDVITAREQLALAEQTAASYDHTAAQVRSRYERGVRTALDLRLALSEFHNAHALAAARRRQLDAAVRSLEALLARYPAGEMLADGPLPTPVANVPAGVPADLLVRRPDLAAAERRLAGAGARVNSARAALFPRLSAAGSRGRVGEDFGDLLDADFGVWSIAGNLVQPIFEGGRLRGNLELERGFQREALAAYFAAVLRAYREVEQFFAAERHLADREQALVERTTQAEAARVLAQQRYLSGLEDYVTVLEAQRTALLARAELIAVRGERLTTRVDLYLALGGGFERQRIEASSVPRPDPAVAGEESPS